MKKLLLPFFATACAFSVSAAEVTEVLTAESFGLTAEVTSYKDYTFKSEKTGVTYKANMAASAMTIQLRSTNNNSGVVITDNPNGYVVTKVNIIWTNGTAAGRELKFYSNAEAYTSAGDLYATPVLGTEVGSLKNNVKADTDQPASIDFSTPAKFIGFRSNSGAQYLKQVEIVYETGGAEKKDAGLSYSVDAVEVNLGEAFTAPVLSNPNNLAVTYTSSAPAVATVDADGKVTLVGAGVTTITAKTAGSADFYPGSADYVITVFDAPATSIANFYEKSEATNNAPIKVGFPMTVTYVNGINVYVTDGTSASLLYGTNNYQKGDVVPAGWAGVYAPFNQLPEIKPAPGSAFPAASGTTEVTYKEVALAQVDLTMVNQVVVIKNVTFAAATPSGSTKTNFNGADGEDNLNFRNNFADVPSVDAGTYDVTAAIACYKTDLQVYPIAYAVSTGLGVVEADNAPAVYYNLQGIRVANPENGVFIRVQGKNVSKVVK